MAKKLTDALVKKIAVPKGEPRFTWDALATGFGLKVTPTGKRLFVLQTKFPGHTTQTTRTLGAYPGLTLEAARAKAQTWYGLAKAGIDPAIEEQKKADAERRAAMLAQEHSFGAVAEAYINHGLTGQRWGHRVKRQIEKELIPHWGTRPIAEITRRDVVALLEAIKRRPAKAYALNIYQTTRSLFNWVIEQDCYGLESSPLDHIKPKRLFGQKNIRTRVLTNDELSKLWAATETIGYPFGPMVKMLMLTGSRLSAVAEAPWAEFDLVNRVWVIPPGRLKVKAEHIVPLGDDLMLILEGLPRSPRGDYLFSTNGDRPVSGLYGAKERIDREMGEVPDWIFHDIRRTVRTRLSELKIPEHVAELTIGHARRGIGRVYDVHEFKNEIREALEAWANLLKTIMQPTPKPDNKVVKFKALK